MTVDVAAGQEALRQMRIDEAITAFDRALQSEPENVPAHLGLYEAYQVKGDRAAALAHQRRALARQQLFLEKSSPPGKPMLLVVAMPGDWQANVPLEFLYPSLHIGIQKLFVGDGLPLPDPSKLSCDVIFNAVAQSETADATLADLKTWLPTLGRPVLNDPARVRKLTRDGVARDFSDLSGVLAPRTERLARNEVPRQIRESLVIRPVGSQAGAAFARIAGDDEMTAYLAATAGDEFYVSPFIDYRRSDGFYRKYRIIFVGGIPYGQHLAISDRWMVHYYNARNEHEAWIRSEEEAFLADVSSVFDGPRRDTLDALAQRVGLDYFGIDCSLLGDGRVLIFEIDPAMIVHLGDPIELYPYKHRYVPRIPAALEALVASRAALTRSEAPRSD